MKTFCMLAILLSAASVKAESTKFLSTIHSDMDAICHFNPELKKVASKPELIGPLLRPLIKSTEVYETLKTLDGAGADRIQLLAKAFGYEPCDLIKALAADDKATDAK